MPEVSLTDTSGRAYNLATTPSKPVTLLFFGYTHCPDVCIAVLSDVSMALQRLAPADRDHIQLIFITTDPARDKEKQIRRYLDRFNPTFVGLTGQMSTIKGAASEVGVDIEGKRKLSSGGYEVGHSAQVIGFSRTSGVVIWRRVLGGWGAQGYRFSVLGGGGACLPVAADLPRNHRGMGSAVCGDRSGPVAARWDRYPSRRGRGGSTACGLHCRGGVCCGARSEHRLRLLRWWW